MRSTSVIAAGDTHAWPVGWMKYRQAWTRLSVILARLTRFSCSRYESKRASMFSTMGFQLCVTGSETVDVYVSQQLPLLVVHKVAEAGRVDDGEAEADAVLLDVCVGAQPRARKRPVSKRG